MQYVYPDHQIDIADGTDQRNPQDPMDKHEMVYHQTLIRSKDGASTPITDGNGGGLSVIRKNDWQVNLYCYYNASGQVHSRFHTKAEATQNVSGTNEFKFRLVMYKDNKFEQPYTHGEVPIMWLGESVHMAVEWDTTAREQPEGYYVRGFECWATKSGPAMTRNNGLYYDLSESDGCSADTSFKWDVDRRDDDRDPFYFDAFAWISGGAVEPTAIVYINCRVRACEDSIDENIQNDYCYKPQENVNCGTVNARSRRGADGNNEKTVERVVSSAPLIIKKRDTLTIERGHIVGGGNGARMASALFSMFVTTMFFCLLVISYRVYKLRHNYNTLREMADHN
ncbi:uncharacterized protein LOC142334633 [Convolutriloba macropyga]|uniref:uncharacterized protein LOC142334633 n=1 Tax=Convolutriloba macropyga TaxID=536237 RepID=UPI003F526DBE